MKREDSTRKSGRFSRASRVQKDASVLTANWYDSVGWEYDSIQWSRRHLISNALHARLDRLHLPRPQYSDATKWGVADEFSPYEGERVLKREAIVEVRTAIRKEERERREVVDFWLKTIGAVLTIGTGLTGALIGLISIWRHKAP